MTSATLLEVKGLKKYFPLHKGVTGKVAGHVHAVDDVSFSLERGKTLGLVGESGCGKSTTGRCILRLIEPTAGEILFEGRDIRGAGEAELRPLRKNMQLIFQDPFASLNPRLSIGEIIEEGLIVHGVARREERRELIQWVLGRVGIRPELMNRYPHEFSGGQRQRIGIARSLVLEPKLIIADEPVSALDVSIQAQVMNLLVEIQEEFRLSYVVIAHDLSVVEYLSDHVAIMYLGKIVELASDRDLYTTPLHPYTQSLLASIPFHPQRDLTRKNLLQGEVPSPIAPPSGCRFHTRCPKRMEICDQQAPEFLEAVKDHWVACHLHPREKSPREVPLPQHG
jgi:oligopeptide transport system ATP-binding protein